MIIVLDTNTFWSDVYATKPWLSAVLGGAKAGDFEVVVPETVIRELANQFPGRLADAITESNAAIAKAAKKLRRLGLEAPAAIEIDEESLCAGYEQKIRMRLSAAGCRIEADPEELGWLIDWAVQKREPFKSSGEGLPDAAIWLTTLKLARNTDQVLLVSTNTKDFGNGESKPDLAPELVGDLERHALPRERVQLISDVKQLVDEIVAPMAQADARAKRLVEEPELSARIRTAIQEALLYTPISQEHLRLGVELDNDPQPIALDVEKLEVSSAREAGEGQLFIRIVALCELHLDMAVYKADFAIADEDSPISISGDLNDHYYEGEAEIAVWMTLDLYSDPTAEEVEIAEVVNADRLSDEEALELRLRRGAADPLMEAIRDPNSRGEMEVANYSPDVSVEAGVDSATVEDLRPSAVRVESVDESSSDGLSCSLVIECEGDVTWVVSTPSGFDSERYPSLSETPEEGGWLSDVEANVPLRLSLRATLSPSGEWIDLEVDEVALDEAEVKRRAERDRRVEAADLEWIEEGKRRRRRRRGQEREDED